VTRLNPQGQQMVVRFIAPGDMFGVAMAIQVEAYPGTATAAVDSLALAWPNSVWSELLTRHPGLASIRCSRLGRVCRTRKSAFLTSRRSTSNSASPARSCNWRSRPAGKPRTVC